MTDAHAWVPLILRRIANKLCHPLGINPFPRAFEYAVAIDRATAFDEICKANIWNSSDSVSGPGSELEKTRIYRAALVKLIQEKHFTSMFDAPCGDLNWMPSVLAHVNMRYEGGDIAPSVVAAVKARHPALSIRQFDIGTDIFPEVDVWHCRDCLFHLPFADIRAALQNFVKSGIPYALITTHRARLLHRNLELSGVGFRLLDMERAPLSLPKPLAYLSDFRPGKDFPRYVGLWSREMIQEALKDDLPIIYVLDASIAVTGAFISARHDAMALKDSARTVLVLPRGSAIPEAELKDFWRIDYVPVVNLSKSVKAIIRYLPALFIGAWQLKRLMRRDGAKHLQLNDFFLMQGAVLRLLGYRGHIATWVRCEPVRFAGFLAKPMLAIAAASASRMVTVSSFIRGLLPSYEVEIIPNFYAGRTRSSAPDAVGEKNIVYVGNYIRGKGQDMALRAFAIAAKQDATLKLSFYGADMGLHKNRDYRASLEIAAQQLGIASRVVFGDFIPDTYHVLETAYAALNCSVSESFSRTVLEANGAGVPVIATASGGPQEIVKDGVTGYIVPVNDAEAVAARIITLATNPQLAAQMGQAAAEHIRQHFSEAVVHEKLRAVLSI